MKNKLIIAGGSGFLGAILAEKFKDSYSEIVILSRKPQNKKANISYVEWNAKTLDRWVQNLEKADVIINLTGKSVNCRYTEKNKKEIIASRVNATQVIGRAIQQCIHPPKVWINAGSAAIFGNSGNELKDESSSTGSGFSPEVCKQWENAFHQAEAPGTRKIFLRIGIVLQHNKGLLKPFINMAKAGLGGKFGTGQQYISWIHEKDFANIIQWVIETETISGILHCTSPHPSTNKEFMHAVTVACRSPFALPNPAFLIRIGAVFIGTEAELVLSGRRVVSKILKEKEFNFIYPQLNEAIKTLVN